MAEKDLRELLEELLSETEEEKEARLKKETILKAERIARYSARTKRMETDWRNRKGDD